MFQLLLFRSQFIVEIRKGFMLSHSVCLGSHLCVLLLLQIQYLRRRLSRHHTANMKTVRHETVTNFRSSKKNNFESSKLPLFDFICLQMIEQCGATIGCYRYPNDCVDNCEYFLSWKPDVDTVEITVSASISNFDTKWVAVGFSYDGSMVGGHSFF